MAVLYHENSKLQRAYKTGQNFTDCINELILQDKILKERDTEVSNFVLNTEFFVREKGARRLKKEKVDQGKETLCPIVSCA